MTRVLIDWSDTHHPRDDYDLIRNVLAAGGDEGPLIVVPASVKRVSGSRPIPVVFKDVDHYLGHLAMYDGDVGDDRFVGLVRGSSKTDWEQSLAALQYIQQVLAPGTDGIPKKRVSKRETVALDYLVIPGGVSPRTDFKIESTGEGLFDVVHAYPELRLVIGAIELDE